MKNHEYAKMELFYKKDLVFLEKITKPTTSHKKKDSKVKFKTLKDNEFKNGIQFISSVICNEKTIGIGKGSSKKIAEQEASKNALI